MNRQRWLRTRRRVEARRRARSAFRSSFDEFVREREFEQLKNALPKPYADYVPDMPWERDRG